MRNLTERELLMLRTAAESPGFLTQEEFAEAILPMCNGPRTAKTYTAECLWELLSLGCLVKHERRPRRYKITNWGLSYLRLAVR
jgi:hypothetical protein